MYRKNPLLQPPTVLQHIAGEYDKRIEEKEREFRNWLSDFYEQPSDSRLRYTVEKLAEWSALQDMQGFVYEIIDAAEEAPESLEALLLAMYDRLESILESPPPKWFRARFAQAQSDQRISYEGAVFEDVNTRYSDHFALPYDTFIYFYLHSFVLSGLIWTIEKLVATMRASDDYEYVATTSDFVNKRHQKMAENITDRELANVLEHINTIIVGRTTYGVRKEMVNSLDFTKLVWSNGSASWYPSAKTDERALIQKLFYQTEADVGFLDANMIIVPYPPAIVELVLSSLYPLPLYRYSFEGKQRRRAAGKEGPLVSDREAKQLITSVAEMAVRHRYEHEYGIPPEKIVVESDGWEIKAVTNLLWEGLVTAKRSYDEDKFEELVAEYGLAGVPAFYGRLKQWFFNLEL